MSGITKNRFIIALKYFFIVVVTLLAIEIFLRSFMPKFYCDNFGIIQYDKELETVAKNNAHLVRLKDYLEEYVTNKYGTINYQNDFKAYRYLVFTIGDSFTQGIGVPPDASYPFQLDLLLNIEDKEYKRNYGVINLGFSSYGGEQYLLSLKRYIKIFGKPDFILVLGCGNDYTDDLRFKAFQAGKTIDLIDGNPNYYWFHKPLTFLGNETQIGLRVQMIFRAIQKSSLKRNAPELQQEEKCTAEREAPIYEQFNKIAKELDAKLILSWANRDESYPWLRNWAQSQNIAFADWQPTLMSVQDHIPVPDANSHSGGHFRNWVNGLIARAFARNIQDFQTLRTDHGNEAQASVRK